MKFFINRTAYVILALVVMCLAVLHSQRANAQDQPPIVLGVVAFDVLLQESKAGQSLKASMKKAEAGFNDEVAKQEKAFRAAEDKIRAGQGSQTEAELKKKMADLQAQMEDANKQFKEKHKLLEGRRDKALEQIRTTALDIIEQISKERGLTLVLNKYDVILSHPVYELTDETLKRLDAKLPSVKM